MLAAEAADSDRAAPLPVSLYVHVPFCLSKCAYCDFFSVTGGDALHAPYVDAALFEAGHWSHFGLLDDVPSLYFGGGTPTALGPELVRLLKGLRETARLRADAEVTVETNPETTHSDLVHELVAGGVTRFSLGVQSFDDAVLRTLGRCHDAARSREAVAILRRSRLPFSIDLICGVPGQTFASWDDTLERAVASGARHVSVYPLSVEPGTPLAGLIERGEVPPPDPDLAADMMLAAEVALAAAGLPRYEVSNYAAPGFESKHNTAYWTGGAYLGLGPGASSMLPHGAWAAVADAEGWAHAAGALAAEQPSDAVAAIAPEAVAAARPARTRHTRAADLTGYLRAPLARPGSEEHLTAEEAEREDIMLGLRLTAGVGAARIAAAGLEPVLRRLESDGLVRVREGRWSTTQKGWLLGNEVFAAVWAGE